MNKKFASKLAVASLSLAMIATVLPPTFGKVPYQVMANETVQSNIVSQSSVQKQIASPVSIQKYKDGFITHDNKSVEVFDENGVSQKVYHFDKGRFQGLSVVNDKINIVQHNEVNSTLSLYEVDESNDTFVEKTTITVDKFEVPLRPIDNFAQLKDGRILITLEYTKGLYANTFKYVQNVVLTSDYEVQKISPANKYNALDFRNRVVTKVLKDEITGEQLILSNNLSRGYNLLEANVEEDGTVKLDTSISPNGFMHTETFFEFNDLTLNNGILTATSAGRITEYDIASKGKIRHYAPPIPLTNNNNNYNISHINNDYKIIFSAMEYIIVDRNENVIERGPTGGVYRTNDILNNNFDDYITLSNGNVFSLSSNLNQPVDTKDTIINKFSVDASKIPQKDNLISSNKLSVDKTSSVSVYNNAKNFTTVTGNTISFFDEKLQKIDEYTLDEQYGQVSHAVVKPNGELSIITKTNFIGNVNKNINLVIVSADKTKVTSDQKITNYNGDGIDKVFSFTAFGEKIVLTYMDNYKMYNYLINEDNTASPFMVGHSFKDVNIENGKLRIVSYTYSGSNVDVYDMSEDGSIQKITPYSLFASTNVILDGDRFISLTNQFMRIGNIKTPNTTELIEIPFLTNNVSSSYIKKLPDGNYIVFSHAGEGKSSRYAVVDKDTLKVIQTGVSYYVNRFIDSNQLSNGVILVKSDNAIKPYVYAIGPSDIVLANNGNSDTKILEEIQNKLKDIEVNISDGLTQEEITVVRTELDDTLTLIETIKDEVVKEELKNKAEELKQDVQDIQATLDTENAEKEKMQITIDIALESISKVKDEVLKDQLLNRIKIVQSIVIINADLSKLENVKVSTFEDVDNLINDLEDLKQNTQTLPESSIHNSYLEQDKKDLISRIHDLENSLIDKLITIIENAPKGKPQKLGDSSLELLVKLAIKETNATTVKGDRGQVMSFVMKIAGKHTSGNDVNRIMEQYLK